jgi:photosystem II stability/assembly factor-like uncharacterized protein/predicted acyltransferase (DUF342 family)
MSNSSWKQYGGIQKTDRFQNLGIGTLVADQVLLKQKNTTNFIINGALFVKGDITTENGGNIYSANDLFVPKNTYLTNHLYLGTQEPNKSGTYGYIFGDSVKGTFGVDAEKSTNSTASTFDIHSKSSSVFSARTTSSTINNILAQNATTDGINAAASTGTSALNLIVGGSTIGTLSATSTALSAQAPTISINSLTSNLSITAANSSNFTTTRGNATIQTSSGNTILRSSSATIIDSSAGIQFRSKLGISNRGIFSSISGELVTIYDISTNLYLYDYYKNTASNTGNALTLVTSDSSSNTFFNILTPAKNGFSIGGGTFISDYTRSMGTFGLTTVSGIYIPSQTIVSGSSKVNYLTCTGINTYVPKSETYVLDINGPTKIGNGEVNTMFYMNYEILQMKFSKRSIGYGIAVGSPTNISNPYGQTISYTQDGGKNWRQFLISTDENLNTLPQALNTYIYDRNYAFFSSSTPNTARVGFNKLYYTRNGGSDWIQIGDGDNADKKRSFYSININDRMNGTCTLLISGVDDTNPSSKVYQLYYYSIPQSLTNYTFLSSIKYGVVPIDTSLNSINDSDSSGNFLYVVGDGGIQQFDVSGSVPVSTNVYTSNPKNNYNSVYCFDASYAIAVGSNIISYTKNASTWTDIVLTGIFKSVHIYDLSNAVAVGDSGAIAYTTNGSLTWQYIPLNILNSAGTASQITNSNTNLRSVFMPNLDSFVIADVIKNYSNGGNGFYTEPYIQGRSRILYGFYPNVFNSTANKVLDVSGNSEFTGDILIDGSGQLRTTSHTFSLLNDTVNIINMGSSTTTINVGGSLTSVKIPNTLFVSSDVSLNSRLYVLNDVSLSKRLFVHGDVSLNSKLSVLNDVSLNKRLFVSDDVSLNKRLLVGGNTHVGNIIAAANQTFYSDNYDSVGNDLFMGPASALSTNKTIYVGSQSTTGSTTIYIGNDRDKVFLRGDVTTKTVEDLNVVSKNIYLNQGATAVNNAGGAGLLICDAGDVSAGFILMSDNQYGYNFRAASSNNIVKLDVKTLTANSGVNSPMVVLTSSAPNFTTTNDSNYAITVNNNVDGNYNGTGNFYVAKKSILNGDVSMNGSLVIGSTTTFNGTLIMKSNITIAADSTFNGDMYVSKTGYFGNSVAINKASVSYETDVVLDISGNMSQIGGAVFQF